MINKEEIAAILEIQTLQKDEQEKVINADMPMVLKKVSGGLTFKEMKHFKDLKIFNLKEKLNEDGKKVQLTNEDVIFDVVVPLLELRGVNADDLNDVQGSDYLTFYRRVEALTNNPKLQESVEKKS